MSIYDMSAYEVIEDRAVSDVKSQGYILRHKKSGAKIAVLSNDDDNKVFYIAFRTTPQDETGVPHIIEHTVLCGSDKFPAKDPFVELVKGSLNTFLNAMTYPDKTMYPVASYNDRDFKNLMDVYMDAVFHPNITKYKQIFMQEGWHYELESADAPVTINGVVYNEMKGAYSSPEEVLQNQIFKSLFPDNTYSQDSGGNPVHIPKLTYEDYLAFYKKYYHPSNSYIYLYGDMDIEERLDWMDREYLCHYDAICVDDTKIPLQKPFDAVKEVRAEYSIASDDDEENKTYLAYTRVVGTAFDRMEHVAFDVLDYALVSAQGAPIKTALIDAGIGEDVSGSYEDSVLQPVFSIVAKNANESDRERFLSIIEETLRALVRDGIDHDSLLAAINSSEFRFREADFGQFPKGLLYGIDCMDSWLFDDNQPFLHLECLDTFAALKSRIGTGYFEELVQKYLLDNTHGSHVVVVPKKGRGSEEEEALKAALDEYKKSLSEEEIKALVEQTKALKQYQEEPSSEEDLAKIPMLTRKDMKREAMPLTNIETGIGDVKVVRHEVDSNGIDYLSLMFEAKDIATEDVPYLSLLASVLSYVDTANYSYAALSNAINIHTGGISLSTGLYPIVSDRGGLEVKFEIRIRVLAEQLAEAMKLVEEILLTSKLSDTKRLSEIVAQTKARMQASLSSAGHSVASMRGMAGFSQYASYQEALRGIAYYRFICSIESQLKADASVVVDKLRAVCEQLFARNRLLVSFTSVEEAYRKAEPILAETFAKLPEKRKIGDAVRFDCKKKNEAFTDASQIQYVARCGNYRNHGYAYTGALRILRMILSYDYLWINIRVKGGAYGCMSAALRTGESYFVSYRDPNLGKTIEVYKGIPAYLRAFDPDERDMAKYIIGTFGALDTPLYPEAKGARSMAAYLEELTIADIQRERDEILNAKPEDIRALADLIQSVLDDEALCVIGNENTIRDAGELFDTIEKLV